VNKAWRRILMSSGPLTVSAAALLCVPVLTSCGSSSTSTPPPSTPVTPTPPAPAGNTWSVAGRLVETSTQQGVAGAQVTPSWDLAASTSSGDGSYELGARANPPSNPYKLTISGAGLLTREIWVNWQSGPRNGVMLDAIRNAAPFSMDYYRQLVRGTYDQPGAPWPILRWNAAPKFYLKTVDQNGRAVEPEVLDVVKDALLRAVPAYTGGKLAAVALETGTEARGEADGWINVNILRDPNERTTCGRAFVGANPGTITLYNDVCSCGSRKIPGATVMHEVGHALGFFHVSDRNSVMYPFIPGNCPPGDLSAAERLHASIAYSRPRGNLDPDNDPSSGRLLSDGAFPRILADR
jgi:hypothetical protein